MIEDVGLARFREAKIAVVVYLEPFNVQYVRSLGMSLQRVPRRADDSAGGRT